MSYEQIIKDTEELTRKMSLKWDIISAVLILMLATLIILIAKMIWEDRKARRAVQNTVGGDEYRPHVLPDVQIGPDGTEYHRMGVPGKEV
jgi:NADH:ubiquinone oxidoreductase subunit 6 (subunit J)